MTDFAKKKIVFFGQKFATRISLGLPGYDENVYMSIISVENYFHENYVLEKYFTLPCYSCVCQAAAHKEQKTLLIPLDTTKKNFQTIALSKIEKVNNSRKKY